MRETKGERVVNSERGRERQMERGRERERDKCSERDKRREWEIE